MRVVLYALNYHPDLTGIGKYVGEMAEWFARQNHKMRVITAPPYYPQWQVHPPYRASHYLREILKGMTIWRCPLWVPSRPNGLKRILHLASFALSSLPIALGQVRFRPDVVIVIEPPFFCAPAAFLMARLSRGKAVLHIQDFEIDAAFDLGLLKTGPIQKIVDALERWLMRRFDLVSTISVRMVERLESKGIPKKRGLLFPNWVDTECIFPRSGVSTFRRELGIRSDDIVALYSGNMGQKQGLEIVVDAARRLEAREDLVWVMCGRGSALEALHARAAALTNMKWIPLQPRERLNDLLNIADIHLLPQREDAADLVMPSKLTGILASGRPVVATALLGTEVANVVNSRGIVVPPGDVEAFAGAIVELADSPQARSELGAAARTYAETHLDKEAVLRRFEQKLLTLVGSRVSVESRP